MGKVEVFIDISARHVHLTREDAEKLFGKGFELTPKKQLGGGFQAQEKVALVGPKSRIDNVSILGPFRHTQVELALTDSRKLGIATPIRLSGDVRGSASITIVGPAGAIEIPEGAIAAKRHMHIGKNLADTLGITNDSVVKVRIQTPDRSLVFEDVPCRVQPFDPVGPPAVVHLDTDEANAAGMTGPQMGEIVDIGN